MNMFNNEDERKQALILGAGIALHALLSNQPTRGPDSDADTVARSFDISAMFWARATELTK